MAWVTGASSGLGRASALSLAREGAAVAVSSRDVDRLRGAADEIAQSGATSIAVPLDVTDAAAITACADEVKAELGPIDILIANAGGPPPGTFDSFDDTTLYDAFTLTTGSAWRLAKAVLPSMREQGRGVMIFVTSGSTKQVIPNLILSNMMRAAVVGMAKTLSKELGPEGIRVLSVAPGKVETQRLVQLDEAAAARTGRTRDEVRRQNESAIPLRRYGEPTEFGDAVAFLASDRASYISGVNVSVDGGALHFVLS